MHTHTPFDAIKIVQAVALHDLKAIFRNKKRTTTTTKSIKLLEKKLGKNIKEEANNSPKNLHFSNCK